MTRTPIDDDESERDEGGSGRRGRSRTRTAAADTPPAGGELDDFGLVVFEPVGDPALDFAHGQALAPLAHLSFDAFWDSLGLPPTVENTRTKELFYEWLGNQGYDVHRRDEPTILGDAGGWQEVWARYHRRRLVR